MILEKRITENKSQLNLKNLLQICYFFVFLAICSCVRLCAFSVLPMCLHLFSLNFPASALSFLYASLVQWIYTVIVGGLFSVTVVFTILCKKQRQRIIKAVELLVVIYAFYYAVDVKLLLDFTSGVNFIFFLLIQLTVTNLFYRYFFRVVEK